VCFAELRDVAVSLACVHFAAVQCVRRVESLGKVGRMCSPTGTDSEGEGVGFGWLARESYGTQADLAQVAFGQTQAFHLWTWIERTAFNREVPGSSPGFGTSHISY